jgi:hypothetical protein
VRILGFPLRFSVLRSVLLGWPKKSGAKVFLRDHGGRAPPPHTLHAIAARQNEAQPRTDGLRGPCFAVEPRFFAHLSCTRRQSLAQSLRQKSGTKSEAKVWILKVWSKVWSFFYEIFRTPLPGASLLSKSHKGLLLRWMSYSNLKPYLTPLQNLNGEYRDTMIN